MRYLIKWEEEQLKTNEKRRQKFLKIVGDYKEWKQNALSVRRKKLEK